MHELHNDTILLMYINYLKKLIKNNEIKALSYVITVPTDINLKNRLRY